MFFAHHGECSCGIGFRPDKTPRAVFSSELASNRVCAVVVGEAKIQVLSVADVEFAIGILEDVDPKHKQKLAPEVGLEPTTNRLTADRSTTELLRNNLNCK